MPSPLLSPVSDKPDLVNNPRRRGGRWLLILALLSLVLIALAVNLAIRHAEPILRTRVIETLSTRFKSKVELDVFHVSMLRGCEVSGTGLRIFGKTDPNNYEPGIQPIIGVGEFRFHTGILGLFSSPMHVSTVYVKGLQLNLPPKEQRSEMKNMAPSGGKIRIAVDSLVSDAAQLIVNTEKPGKLPLVFAIQHLKMTSIGPNQPMHFEADLINPKPVGNIHSSGSFGPWQADSPRDTPVQGKYSFSHADLSTIKGIGGILSSTGKYAGTLDHITVDGSTDTPDFRIAISGRPVPLHTEFHAVVDGTSGDTYLQPVRAKLLKSPLVATGSIVRTKPQGHHVELDVVIEKGKIDDLLKLAVRTDPPIMTGTVQLKTKFDLPPGEPDVANRLKLTGTFQVASVHFTNAKIQDRIDAISMRSQGKPKQPTGEPREDVQSDLSGTFRLNEGLLSLSQLRFQMPGTQVNLIGQYDLNGRTFDFHGKARLDAKLSQMVTGWKALLLKPVDPFFSKDGAGTVVPIKITGTGTELHFGTDFGRRGGN
jgi:hypothetical protein